MTVVERSLRKPCVDCGTDIRDRNPAAYLCVVCAALRKRLRDNRLKPAWFRSLPAERRRWLMDRANAADRLRYREQHPIRTAKCESCPRTFEVKGGYRRRWCAIHAAQRHRISKRTYSRRLLGWPESSLRRAKAA